MKYLGLKIFTDEFLSAYTNHKKYTRMRVAV